MERKNIHNRKTKKDFNDIFTSLRSVAQISIKHVIDNEGGYANKRAQVFGLRAKTINYLAALIRKGLSPQGGNRRPSFLDVQAEEELIKKISRKQR